MLPWSLFGKDMKRQSVYTIGILVFCVNLAGCSQVLLAWVYFRNKFGRNRFKSFSQLTRKHYKHKVHPPSDGTLHPKLPWKFKDWKDGKPSQVLFISHRGCKCIELHNLYRESTDIEGTSFRFGPTVPTTVSWHHMIWGCSPRPTRTYPLPKPRAFGTDVLTDLFFSWSSHLNMHPTCGFSSLRMPERLQMARFTGPQLVFSRIHESSWRRLDLFLSSPICSKLLHLKDLGTLW